MDEITTVKNQVKFAGWISMVEECQNSGLSIRTWCKENNVCYKAYLYRLRRLRQMFLQEHSKEITPEMDCGEKCIVGYNTISIYPY